MRFRAAIHFGNGRRGSRRPGKKVGPDHATAPVREPIDTFRLNGRILPAKVCRDECLTVKRRPATGL